MKDSLDRLKNITAIILDPSISYLEIRNACESLSDFFYEISGFNDGLKENDDHVFSQAGKALSPNMAAMCIKDMMRTRTFLSGINQAISDRLDINPGQPVKILYAGTGPFATLLTPLVTRYSPEQLQIVMLEINTQSINYLKKVISGLAIESYVTDLVHADAVIYSIPDNLQPDIIVSETMNAALQTEPQVEILANLVAQCKHQPLLIPENIQVTVCLAGYDGIEPVDPLELGMLLELNADTAIQIHNCPGEIPVLNQGIQINIPSQYDSRLNQLSLFTTIKVYKDYQILFNESGLTIPIIQMIISRGQSFPARLVFFYDRGKMPAFRYKTLA